MIPVYNEVDIVGQVIEHLTGQGVKLVIVDNGSTDGSFEVIRHYLGRGVLSVERLATEKYEMLLLRRKLHEMMLEHEPDWAFRCSADEFLESPYHGLSLSKGIQLEVERGHNMIQFNNFEFFPTEKDHDSQEKDVRKRLRYYSWHDDNQYLCSKIYPHMNPERSVHEIDFPDGIHANVSPNKFVLRHYKIRSYEHGLRKIFHERLPRFSPELRARGWNIHYDNFGTDRNYFIIDSRELTRYDEDGNWNLTKTFDGSFGAWNPASDNERISQLIRENRELKEALGNSLALRLARRVPFGKQLHHLVVSEQ
jgi:glycosyltransferase involved in cell wall biosynthesis